MASELCFGYLGLLQNRSRCMTPPPQVREQSDHSDQPDHWPCTALGPWSPKFTHCPLRHHCIMGKKYDMGLKVSVIHQPLNLFSSIRTPEKYGERKRIMWTDQSVLLKNKVQPRSDRKKATGHSPCLVRRWCPRQRA